MNPEQRQQAKDALAKWEAENPDAARLVKEAGKPQEKQSVDEHLVTVVADVERVQRAVLRPAEPGVHRDARHATFGPPDEAPKPPGVAVADEAWAKSKEARIWYLYKRGKSQSAIAAEEKLTKNAVKQAVFMAEKAVAKLKAAPGWVSTDMLLYAIENAHAHKHLTEWSEEEMLPGERACKSYAELSAYLDGDDDDPEFFPDSEFE
ncbi:MAG: hypothetical protein ACHQ9S_27090 [Candidatus Binatia bacterium]